MEKKKARQVNFEYLRCFSMFLIVLGHYFGNVSGNADFAMNSPSWFLYYLINSIEGIGVNLFIIISGYFLLDSRFSVKKIVNMLFQVFTYSVGLYLIMVVITHKFSIKDFASYWVPIFSRKYWFATEYVRFYLIFPILNLLIHRLTEKQHRYIACLLVFMNAIYPTIMEMDARLKYLGNWSLWFVTLYFVVTYLKLYPPKVSTKMLWAGWGLSALAMFASKVLIDNVTMKLLGRTVGSDLFSHNNSIFMTLAALCCFMLFACLKVNENSLFSKFIMMVSPLTFGVYLFHEHTALKGALYSGVHDLFMQVGVDNWSEMLWIPLGLVAICGIFALGCVIEWLRQHTVQHLVEIKPVIQIENWLQEKYDGMMVGGENE